MTGLQLFDSNVWEEAFRDHKMVPASVQNFLWSDTGDQFQQQLFASQASQPDVTLRSGGQPLP